jgi:hypothetical protein
VKKVWHYTTARRLAAILQAGELRFAAGLLPKGEKPVVWFSSNEEWEPTANIPLRQPDGRMAIATKDATCLLEGGLARIGVACETAAHDWEAYKRLSGITPKHAREMYKAAIAQGARPGQWFANFEPVPRSQWLAVEVWDGREWRGEPGFAANPQPR